MQYSTQKIPTEEGIRMVWIEDNEDILEWEGQVHYKYKWKGEDGETLSVGLFFEDVSEKLRKNKNLQLLKHQLKLALQLYVGEFAFKEEK